MEKLNESNLFGFTFLFSLMLLKEVQSNSISNETYNKKDSCVHVTRGICLPHGYDKSQSPKLPISIKTELEVTKITDINDRLSTIQILMYLTIDWVDDRITYTQTNFSDTSNNWGKEIQLDSYWTQHLWFPDLFVYRMKHLKTPAFLQPYQCK